MRRAVSLVLVAVAVVLFAAPADPALVERWYSEGLYSRMQPAVTEISNRLPFAVFDLILAATLVAVLWILTAAIRGLRPGQRWRTLGRAGVRLLTLGAVLYIWFVAAWGMNYRRVPLLERLELAHDTATTAAVVALGRQAVDQLNALHARAHAGPWVDPWNDGDLQEAFRVTHGYLGGNGRPLHGRLKVSVLGPYFRWASVDGMVDPFALEVLANPDLLPFEKPFVAAHEWSHLAGYADESEASFAGWLACVRAGVGAQYSAWLFLYWEVSAVAPAADREALAAALAPGPQADIAAVNDRIRRGQLVQLRRVSWAAYDQYLKANRIEEGVRNYNAVLTLLARARFAKGWVPVRSAAPHDASGSGAS